MKCIYFFSPAFAGYIFGSSKHIDTKDGHRNAGWSSAQCKFYVTFVRFFTIIGITQISVILTSQECARLFSFCYCRTQTWLSHKAYFLCFVKYAYQCNVTPLFARQNCQNRDCYNTVRTHSQERTRKETTKMMATDTALRASYFASLSLKRNSGDDFSGYTALFKSASFVATQINQPLKLLLGAVKKCLLGKHDTRLCKRFILSVPCTWHQ
jgi:hypothetical protein